MTLCCIVYTSISTQKMSDENLKGLLKKTRNTNEAMNITGMLLYLDPYFIQVLEGEEAVITELFNLIKQDSRHNKVSLIYKKPIQERYFLNWTMGFSKINSENLETIEGFTDFLQKPSSEFFTKSHRAVDELLYKFKHEILF